VNGRQDWDGRVKDRISKLKDDEIGYQKITPDFNNPKLGDIYIIHRTKKHRYGHIAGFTGSQWVSDFKQTSYDVYNDQNVTYSYYRLAPQSSQA